MTGLALLLAIGVCLALDLSYAAHAGNLNVKRANGTALDMIKATASGLLFKNGEQTSCEVVPIDSGAGFVAAGCLDFANDQLSTQTEYRVIVGKPGDTNLDIFKVENITVHPSYSPQYSADNIAVIEYNRQTNQTWSNTISGDRSSWKGTVYVRRFISNVSQPQWSMYTTKAQQSQSDPRCKSMSSLFSANMDALVCGNRGFSSAANDTCSVPYTSVIADTGTQMVSAALFSYSVIRSAGMCERVPRYNYYTVLANYMGFASKVLGRDLNMLLASDAPNNSSNRDYSMDTTNLTAAANATIFGGDFYANTSKIPAPLPPLSSAAPNPSGSKPTSSDSVSEQPTAAPSSNPSTPLTRNEVIVVAVVVPVSSVLIVAGTIFAYKLWKSRRADMATLLSSEDLSSSQNDTHPSIVVSEDTAIRMVPDHPPSYTDRQGDAIIMSTPFIPYYQPDDHPE